MALVIIEIDAELGDDAWRLTGESGQNYGSIEKDGDEYIVDYGVGNGHQYRFSSFAAAEQFVARHAGDIAEGDRV